jgi:uncharacterized repeat protein (TIGR03803 family)
MTKENRNLSPTAAFGAAALVLISASPAANAYAEKVLHSFCAKKHCTDGAEPAGEVAVDQAGNLYGTTYVGGQFGDGVVFQLIPATGQYNVVHSFCSAQDCSDGRAPIEVKPVIDTNGNLYGTTYSGGVISAGPGVVFELKRAKSGWSERVLYAFCSKHSRNCKDAGGPISGLTYAGASSGQAYDGTSPLYGTTPYGGTNGQGAVYEVMPKAGTRKWSEMVLYSFCSQVNCTDGQQPKALPYVDSAGNLYGTTNGGPENQAGTVFELSPSGNGYTETTLYSFCAQANCTDGKEPYANLVMNSAGDLMGTAGAGGSKNDGVVFELAPNGAQWRYSVLGNFTGANGTGPVGNMVLDADGNLFGATREGGSPKKEGTVFEFNGAIQTLYSFCAEQHCPDGRTPQAGVTEDGAGNLYGTTFSGGQRKEGVLYELSP